MRVVSVHYPDIFSDIYEPRTGKVRSVSSPPWCAPAVITRVLGVLEELEGLTVDEKEMLEEYYASLFEELSQDADGELNVDRKAVVFVWKLITTKFCSNMSPKNELLSVCLPIVT